MGPQVGGSRGFGGSGHWEVFPCSLDFALCIPGHPQDVCRSPFPGLPLINEEKVRSCPEWHLAGHTPSRQSAQLSFPGACQLQAQLSLENRGCQLLPLCFQQPPTVPSGGYPCGLKVTRLTLNLILNCPQSFNCPHHLQRGFSKCGPWKLVRICKFAAPTSE